MSGIIQSLTAGRIAIALGAVGVGATIGGVVADHRDGDVARGALIGGATALAGIALLMGGHAVWKNVRTGRAATTTAANGLAHLTPAITRSSTAAVAAPVAPRLSSSFAGQVRATATRLLDDAAATANVLRPVATPVPAFAATPALPVAAGSGSTFLSALTRFVA